MILWKIKQSKKFMIVLTNKKDIHMVLAQPLLVILTKIEVIFKSFKREVTRKMLGIDFPFKSTLKSLHKISKSIAIND